MPDHRKSKELAIWALRYLKNGEGISAFHAYQKAMGDSLVTESDSTDSISPKFSQGFLNDVESAIVWLKSLE